MIKKVLFFAILFFAGSIGANACSLKAGQSITTKSNSSVISQLQNCLSSLGYDTTSDTKGNFGQATVSSIKSFYKEFLNIAWNGQTFGPKAISSVTPKNYNTKVKYRFAKSESEIKKYLALGENYRSYGGGIMTAMPMATDAVSSKSVAEVATGAGQSNDRVSTTNVQVSGIDEPDVVKTDGKNLYMGKPQYWYMLYDTMPMIRESGGVAVDAKMAIMPPYPQVVPKTQIIGINPIADMGIKSESIDTSGEMLLLKDKKVLVVFSSQKITGYDVANPISPVKKWTVSLKDTTSLVTSRLKGNDIYLVTNTSMWGNRPCPIVPILNTSGKDVSIPCNRILIPETISPISQTYTVMKLDGTTGDIKVTSSIAEDGYNSTVSMFENNLYIATNVDNSTKIMNDITLRAYEKHLSNSAISKIRKIQSYDISDYNKYEEIQSTIQKDIANLGDDARLKVEKDTQNEIEKLSKLYIRETYKTKIARININNLQVASVGIVPGRLVNQFAIDEYNGHVRVATTVGEMWGGNSANDVYVLGMDMKEKGSIKDLGLTERIYSVRFMGDTGYLVTFRQTDPFYVLDLKNPSKPVVAGELKIPGYSSYLEDLGNGLVVGLGRENGDLKLSLFNVKDPKNPIEVSKYLLKNNWSEAENNHRAFLKDADHKVFFIPGSDGGYMFSYDNNEITLKKSVAGNNIKRAIYIGNNMYIIADDKITVIDEKTWNTTKEWEIK